MAGKVRHLINRSGRYHARLVVPKDLRAAVGKTELRKPLGADYRQALKLLPGAVAQLQHQIAEAERASGQPQQELRYPLAPDQIAHAHYTRRLAFDDELRNDPRYAAVGIDDVLVGRLREAIAGRADNDELEALVGTQIERFRASGNLDAAKGSDDWRVIARALCSAEYEALERVYERDEGNFAGIPTAPIIANAAPPTDAPKHVSIKSLWADYVTTRQQAGFMRDGGKRQAVAVESLRKHLRHDNAAKVTKADVIAWRDSLMPALSAQTVSGVYLATVRTLFNWALENDRLEANPATTVKQAKPRKMQTREKGFTDAEALVVLKASRSYMPHEDEYGRIREKPQLIAAKRWVPIICAFTGARVSEITQLRKEDFREEEGGWVARITPDAGTVKTGAYRDVPLHPQIIEEGFADFLRASKDGPLFHGGTDPEKYAAKAVRITNQLSVWLRDKKLVPPDVQPNHGWRHRFKTQCRDLGIAEGTYDAIQGHSSRSASANYGDVTLRAKWEAIERLPHYLLS